MAPEMAYEERISTCRRFGFTGRFRRFVEMSPRLLGEGTLVEGSQIATTNIVELSSRFIDIGIATTHDQHGVNNSRWKGP